FLIVKSEVIVAAGELNCGMKRRKRLHNDFAFNIAAAGAAGDLREQLKGAFAGTEIGLMQREVGKNDSDEGHVRKMQALGDHLRADENINFADAKIAEDFAVIILTLHGVGVHAMNARVGK